MTQNEDKKEDVACVPSMEVYIWGSGGIATPFLKLGNRLD
jgi:hypothetical protein